MHFDVDLFHLFRYILLVSLSIGTRRKKDATRFRIAVLCTIAMAPQVDDRVTTIRLVTTYPVVMVDRPGAGLERTNRAATIDQELNPLNSVQLQRGDQK